MTEILTPANDGGGGGDRIVDEPASRALSSRFLAYALSTITSRALPDVRDGLKPVQRRILYAMRALKLDPTAGFKKCGKIVGDVMGNFHPHGDQAIYDALVRMAQDFAVRAPLVEPQGNFGNQDGDPPAAYRYTEARLTRAAEALLEGLDQGAVDFRLTYNEEDEEPVVLAAAFPNLLVNGATGIAVGMATNIPPHNPVEMIDAARALITDPTAELDALLALAPGPDLPTGGVIIEDKTAIRDAYATGRGGIRVRARWEKEDTGRGTWISVITEIPYQVQKSKLVERIAALMEAKKIPLVGDVRDESAEDVRLVIEPRSRTVDADMMMEALFRQCDLEVRFSLNLNVLDADGAPRVMTLPEVLRAFLDHKRETLQRRSRWRLDKIAARLDILAGLLVAYLNIDEVIRIIREEDEPKPVMMARFGLNDTQTEAVLNMRLRSLRKLEEMEIKAEETKLKDEQRDLQDLLKSDKRQWSRVDEELGAIRAAFAKDPTLGPGRTGVAQARARAPEVSAEAFVAREDITVVLSKLGWIRAAKGHLSDVSDLKFKEGDEAAFAVHTNTVAKLLLFASDGRVYTLACNGLPGGRGAGEPLRLHVDMGEGAHTVAMLRLEDKAKVILASASGRGFIASLGDLAAQKRAGRHVMTLDAGEEVTAVAPFAGDHIAVVGANRKLLVFPASEVPEMARGKGVRLQTYRGRGLDLLTLVDVMSFSAEEGFAWRDASGRRMALETWRDWLGKRAGAGKPVPKGFPKSGRFG